MKLTDIHKKIDSLSDKVDSLCHRPSANSKAEVDEWMENPKIYLLEKMRHVDPLPNALKVEVDNVVELWMEFQYCIYAHLEINSLENFIKKIDKINKCIVNNEDWIDELRRSKLFSEQDVRNISHIELFAWQLPAADQFNANKYAKIGLIMAGLFFVEKLGRLSFNDNKVGLKNPYKEITNLDTLKALYDISKIEVVKDPLHKSIFDKLALDQNDPDW